MKMTKTIWGVFFLLLCLKNSQGQVDVSTLVDAIYKTMDFMDNHRRQINVDGLLSVTLAHSECIIFPLNGLSTI